MAVSIGAAVAGIGLADLLLAAQPRRAADERRAALAGALHAAAEQVLRRRALRRGHRPADQSALDGGAVARRRRRLDRRRGQRRRRGWSAARARRCAALQTGSVRAYAASLFLGVVLILGWYLLASDGRCRLQHDAVRRSSFCRSPARSLVLLAGGRGDRPEREALVRIVALGRRRSSTSPRRCACGGGSTRRAPTSSSSSATRGCRSSASPYHLGVDGISLFLIVLTGFLTPLALLSSWQSVHKSVKLFSFFLLALETRDARRLRLARPVPVLRLLGRDAHPDVLPHRDLGLRAAHLRGDQVHPLHDGRQRPDARRDHRPRATRTQSATGQRRASTCSTSTTLHLSWPMEKWFFLAFALAFAIKVPLFPFHTWLPDAHVEAPTAGSVILAGVMLKMGTYGLLRFAFPLFPNAAHVLRAVHRRPRGHRHHLRRAGRDGAARHEEAGRLLERQPPRLRRARALRDERQRRPGRGLPDAQPRRQHRRALHDRRHALGPPAHAADRRVRRAQGASCRGSSPRSCSSRCRRSRCPA